MPRALAASSTAVSAVVFSRSRIGFASTSSSEPATPLLGDELEREVRLAVGEPAAHRRPDARGDLGIEHVQVERHVDEPRAGDVVERLATSRARCRSGRSRSSSSRGSRQLLISSCSPGVERAHSDRARPALGSTAGSGNGAAANACPARPQTAASGIPWTLPVGDVAGVFRSPWASTHSTPPAARAPRRARRAFRAPPSGRRRARAASSPARAASPTSSATSPARSEDLRQVPGALVGDRRRLRARRWRRCPGRARGGRPPSSRSTSPA